MVDIKRKVSNFFKSKEKNSSKIHNLQIKDDSDKSKINKNEEKYNEVKLRFFKTIDGMLLRSNNVIEIIDALINNKGEKTSFKDLFSAGGKSLLFAAKNPSFIKRSAKLGMNLKSEIDILTEVLISNKEVKAENAAFFFKIFNDKEFIEFFLDKDRKDKIDSFLSNSLPTIYDLVASNFERFQKEVKNLDKDKFNNFTKALKAAEAEGKSLVKDLVILAYNLANNALSDVGKLKNIYPLLELIINDDISSIIHKETSLEKIKELDLASDQKKINFIEKLFDLYKDDKILKDSVSDLSNLLKNHKQTFKEILPFILPLGFNLARKKYEEQIKRFSLNIDKSELENIFNIKVFKILENLEPKLYEGLIPVASEILQIIDTKLPQIIDIYKLRNEKLSIFEKLQLGLNVIDQNNIKSLNTEIIKFFTQNQNFLYEFISDFPESSPVAILTKGLKQKDIIDITTSVMNLVDSLSQNLLSDKESLVKLLNISAKLFDNDKISQTKKIFNLIESVIEFKNNNPNLIRNINEDIPKFLIDNSKSIGIVLNNFLEQTRFGRSLKIDGEKILNDLASQTPKAVEVAELFAKGKYGEMIVKALPLLFDRKVFSLLVTTGIKYVKHKHAESNMFQHEDEIIQKSINDVRKDLGKDSSNSLSFKEINVKSIRETINNLTEGYNLEEVVAKLKENQEILKDIIKDNIRIKESKSKPKDLSYDIACNFTSLLSKSKSDGKSIK